MKYLSDPRFSKALANMGSPWRKMLVFFAPFRTLRPSWAINSHRLGKVSEHTANTCMYLLFTTLVTCLVVTPRWRISLQTKFKIHVISSLAKWTGVKIKHEDERRTSSTTTRGSATCSELSPSSHWLQTVSVILQSP